MNLRREFLEHKNRTIESFNLVSSDISNVQVNMVNLRTMLAASESRLMELASDIAMQKSNDLIVSSTIEGVNNSITEINNQLSSFENTMSQKVTANSNLLKLLNRKLKTVKTENFQLEKKIKSQRKRIAQLNKKIELSAGRKVSARRTARKTKSKKSPRKITTIKTPKTKEVYEVIKEKNPLI